MGPQPLFAIVIFTVSDPAAMSKPDIRN